MEVTGDQKNASDSPNRTFQYLAMLTSSLSIISSGMHYGWTSPSLSKLLHKDSHIPTTNDEGSWIAVALLFGAVSGALLAGVLLDRLGRKNVILMTSIPFFISWIIIAYANSVPVIILARLIAGIPDGLVFCSVPMYLAEISDPEIRGLLGTSMMVTLILGSLLMNIIASYLSVTTAALIAATVPVLLLVSFYSMPESPYYLLMKGDYDQAKRSLKTLKGIENVDQELNRIKRAVETQNKDMSKWSDLFTIKSNRKALFIVLGVRAVHQLTGSIAVMMYIQIIFEEAGDYFSSVASSTIYFAVSMICAGISSVIIDRVGRKPLMIFAIIGSGLALLMEGVYFSVKKSTIIDTSNLTVISIISLVVYVAMFNIGIQAMPLLLLGEMFPTNIKAIAFSLNDVYYCVLSIIVSKFFQYTKDEFGMHVPFLTFSACCALGLLFTIFFVPETKGKTLEQIQDELKGTDESVKMFELEIVFDKDGEIKEISN